MLHGNISATLMPLIALVSLFANSLNFSGIFYGMGFVCNSLCYSLIKCTECSRFLRNLCTDMSNYTVSISEKCTLHGHRLENLKLLPFPAGLESSSVTLGAPLICLQRDVHSLHSLNVQHIRMAIAARKCCHKVIRVTVTRHFALFLLPAVRCQ